MSNINAKSLVGRMVSLENVDRRFGVDVRRRRQLSYGMRYATCFIASVGVAATSSFSFSGLSCLIGRSEQASSDDTSDFESIVLASSASEVSTSIFLLLPFGAGSSGVRQYVTVLVTT